MQTFTLTRPDDWHLHLRDGAALAAVLPHTARQFARAIVMPNLRPPVTTVELAEAYRRRILAALPANSGFEPLMTLYLTDNTAPGEITLAQSSGRVHAVKYYPAGATTNSDSGVTRLERCFPVLEAMEQADLPLLLHGEVTDPEVDVFDREKVFIDTVLPQITQRFAGLRVVLEHVTTREAVQYVTAAPANIAATVTAHHLLMNRNAMFQGGIRAHHYCLPLLKREAHRRALLQAATGGNPKFFLGSDSAPHSRRDKEAPCGHAGIYTAHAAIEFYAEAFEAAGALDKFEAFASFHGADFYRLPRNSEKITLRRESWQVQSSLALGDDELVPLRAGERLAWRLQ
ncbi:MAG: dihydroorotase [Betaproteobacteria bacterium]|nr:dihydroorotase [Betaproteobacteria bacterium]